MISLPSPLEEVKHPLWNDHDIELWIKRDDLIHPVVSGNKYRKLASLIPIFEAQKFAGVISFGGSYSNHLHALAWMCREYKIPATFFVRSFSYWPDSPTLNDIRNWGAQIVPLNSSEYRQKDDLEYLKQLEEEYPGYLIIPEGGSHPGAISGIAQMMEEIETDLPDANLFICPVGTGATFAGMIRTKKSLQKIIGISALKSSGFDEELKSKWGIDNYSHWTLASQWHFGGYGRTPKELILFIDGFEQQHGIRLDPLYNGKAMYAFYQYVRYNLIPPGSKVVFVHTGGLQGGRGVKMDN